MDCGEFLKQFREALDGKVPEDVIRDNAAYYRSYINSQTADGRSEEEILRTLGDPRLLAKTIEESSKFASEKSSRSGYTGGYDNSVNFGNYGNNSYANSGSSVYGNAGNEYGEDGGTKHFRLPGWLVACISVAVVILAVIFVFKAAVFLMPFILVFMAVSFLIKAVNGHHDEK